MEILFCEMTYGCERERQTDGSQYHGKMSHKAREEAVENFRDDAETKIMIASLKCGGIGLVSVISMPDQCARLFLCLCTN